MLEKLKKNWAFVVLAIAVLLLLLNIKQCNDGRKAAASAEKFDQSIAAINDTLKKVRNANGDTVFQKRVAEYNLKALLTSESFKSLSIDNQKFYLELTKVKGLIASSQATINSQAEIIKNLSYDKGTVITDSSICFKKNSTKVIGDSTTSLKFKHTLTFGDKLGSDFKYTYNAKVQTSFIRNKDKTITIEYKIDDPNANVINGQAFIVPIIELTKLQKFMEVNGRWVRPVVLSATTFGGVYMGYKLAK